MSYFDGIELANLRFDAAVQAKCDPKKGWKRAGNKCVRNKSGLGQGGNSTEIDRRMKEAGQRDKALLGALALGAGANMLRSSIKKRQEEKEARDQEWEGRFAKDREKRIVK
jgi:hypothetical protein